MCDVGEPNTPLSVQQEPHLKKTNHDSLELISKKPSDCMSEKCLTTDIDVGLLLDALKAGIAL